MHTHAHIYMHVHVQVDMSRWSSNITGDVYMWDLLCPHEPSTCSELNAFQLQLLTLAARRCRPRLYANLPSHEPSPALVKLANRYFYDGDRAWLEAAKAHSTGMAARDLQLSNQSIN